MAQCLLNNLLGSVPVSKKVQAISEVVLMSHFLNCASDTAQVQFNNSQTWRKSSKNKNTMISPKLLIKQPFFGQELMLTDRVAARNEIL